MPYLFLVPAVLLAALSSLRLCRLAAASDVLRTGATGASEPSPYDRPIPAPAEAAYLAGGPDRVVDVTLIDMTGRGLLHIAHTGWTSVARPLPDTALESEVFAALGPDGRRRTDEVRREVASGASVRALGRSLADLGLAVPPGARASLAEAVAAVRFAFLATLALGVTAVALVSARDLVAGGHDNVVTLAAWFVLPLILTAGTLLMARAEFHPITPWAAPADQELLRVPARAPHPADGGPAPRGHPPRPLRAARPSAANGAEALTRRRGAGNRASDHPVQMALPVRDHLIVGWGHRPAPPGRRPEDCRAARAPGRCTACRSASGPVAPTRRRHTSVRSPAPLQARRGPRAGRRSRGGGP